MSSCPVLTILTHSYSHQLNYAYNHSSPPRCEKKKKGEWFVKRDKKKKALHDWSWHRRHHREWILPVNLSRISRITTTIQAAECWSECRRRRIKGIGVAENIIKDRHHLIVHCYIRRRDHRVVIRLWSGKGLGWSWIVWNAKVARALWDFRSWLFITIDCTV
jgi:hypothetical protein